MLRALLPLAASVPIPPVALTQDAVAAPIRYTLELVEPETPLVAIHVEVAGDADGTSEFSLAEGWAGIVEPGRDLELVEARGERDALACERTRSFSWSVTHAPGERLRVTFELSPTTHRAVSGPPEYYLPILEPRLLHALGAQALPAPDHLDSGEKRAVTLAWTGFAEAGWKTTSSFGGASSVTTTLALDAFRHALFLAGDVRLYEQRIEGQTLALALHGTWKFRDEEFVDLAERIVRLGRDFFADHAEHPYYLISLIQVGKRGMSSWGGTGLTDSFALFMTSDNTLATSPEGGGVAWLLAHELFHEWNGHTITLAQPEELGYWFSEGFTDFYARRLLAHARLLTSEQELASWNQRLAAYAVNPERHAPATRVQEAFWTVRAVGELPYQRGDVLALFVDHAIRGRTQGAQSLDDLMRSLVARARVGAEPFTSAALAAAIGEFAGAETGAAVRAWALDGREPGFPAELGLPGLRLVASDVPSFDTGFDHDASVQGGVVRGVLAGGPASAAGLRDGLRFLGWSVNHGNASQPVEITVQDGAATRTLRYLPHGKTIRGWRLERL
jgi:predicted metalloprotease with PDZ domain